MLNSVKFHTRQNKEYNDLYALMSDYEHRALEYFSENDMEARVLTHNRAGDLKDTVAECTRKYKNPFLEAALWVRGEMLDIVGMLNALRGRDLIQKQQMACESKKRDNTEELQSLSLGKTTLKSFWKSKESKQNDMQRLQVAIDQANTDIEQYQRLQNFITVYHGQFAIEKFKQDKQHQYARMLFLMSTRSVANAGLLA